METLIARIHKFVPRQKSQKQINALLSDIYNEANKIMILPPKDKIDVRFSRLMSRKSGTFMVRCYRNGQIYFRITLSHKLLIQAPNSASRLARTYLHELIHASNQAGFLCQMNNYEPSHGPLFEKKMCLINLFFKGLEPVRVLHNYPVPHRYIVRCTTCKANLRKTINRGSLRRQMKHRSCGGRLIYEPIVCKKENKLPIKADD